MALTRKKPRTSQRKTPVQSRSQDTVETIFEAAARILQTEGRNALTTNAVAARAGISIGTLYAYFPNKEAILLIMARREMRRVQDSVRDAIYALPGPVGAEHVRAIVRALIAGYGRRNRARRILMETLIAFGHSDEIAGSVQRIADLIRGMGTNALPQNARPLSAISFFVVTRAVDSVVRAATYEDAKFIGSQEFEDELTTLVLNFVAPPRTLTKSEY